MMTTISPVIINKRNICLRYCIRSWSCNGNYCIRPQM